MSGDGRRWLVLFDIDGTLLRCGPQIRQIFGSALEEVYGTVGALDDYDFRGRTDLGIILDLMRGAGLDEPTVRSGLEPFRRLYFERLEARLDPAGMRLLPGLPELLEAMAARRDVELGLLTGNFERGARIKLSRFDLNRFFELGAFGDAAAERWRLPPLALEALAPGGRRAFPPRDVLIVGDSILDVECARRHRIPSMAVTTGFTPRADLVAAGADWVVDELPEAARHHPAFAAAPPRSL